MSISEYCLVEFIANSQAYVYLLKHDDIISQVVAHIKSAETFSWLSGIEPAYEGDIGGHVAPMIIDIS